MKRRKFLLGSSAALASGGFLTGTGAFSSASANRSVAVRVVGDENAFLGLSEQGREADGVLFDADLPRTEPETFEIVNQSPTAISEMTVDLLDGNLEFLTDTATKAGNEDCDVHITERSHRVRIENLCPGQAVRDITVRIPSAEPNGSVRDTLRFEGDGEGLQIEAQRTLELVPLVEDVRFTGAGGIQFDTNADDGFDIVSWVAEDTDAGPKGLGDDSQGGISSGASPDEGNSSRNGVDVRGLQPGEITEFSRDPGFVPGDRQQYKLKGNPGGGTGYVAIYFPGVDRSYHHPEFDPETHVIDNWGQGKEKSEPVDGNIARFW